MIKFEIYNSQDVTHAVGMAPVYTDHWFWRAKTSNGRIVSDGSESYYKLGNAKRAVNRFIESLGATNFEIVVLD